MAWRLGGEAMALEIKNEKKKKDYLRSQPLNHMKPARQEVGAIYNKDLPTYLH